eukprot:965659-Rhodomonas_salina.1
MRTTRTTRTTRGPSLPHPTRTTLIPRDTLVQHLTRASSTDAGIAANPTRSTSTTRARTSTVIACTHRSGTADTRRRSTGGRVGWT